MANHELTGERDRQNGIEHYILDTLMSITNTVTLKLRISLPFKISLFPAWSEIAIIPHKMTYSVHLIPKERSHTRKNWFG